MDNHPLFKNWQLVQKSIANATQIRNQSNILKNSNLPIKLLAISKAQSHEKIRTIAGFGQIAFGENYLQETITKQKLLSDLKLEWHFTGNIQSRKAKDIGKYFAWVHTVNNFSNAQKINIGAQSVNNKVNVCIQINSSLEKSKSGIEINNDYEIINLAQQIISLPNLHLRGLMTIPAPIKIKDKNQLLLKQRQPFKMLRQKINYLKTCIPEYAKNLDTLSMGMSDDYFAGILEGATIIRIGSSLFGDRDL